jgi:hypothetical protein
MWTIDILIPRSAKRFSRDGLRASWFETRFALLTMRGRVARWRFAYPTILADQRFAALTKPHRAIAAIKSEISTL